MEEALKKSVRGVQVCGEELGGRADPRNRGGKWGRADLGFVGPSPLPAAWGRGVTASEFSPPPLLLPLRLQ